MTVGTLEDIAVQLARAASELEMAIGGPVGFLASMVPGCPGASLEEIRDLGEALAVPLPTVFSRVLGVLELGSRDLAGVRFGGDISYVSFLRRQIDKPSAVWGGWKPERGVLMIGLSDGYLLQVKLPGEAIFAWPVGESPSVAVCVAGDLERLVRALAVLALSEESPAERTDLAARALRVAGGSDEGASFWADRVMGSG